jgi:hypothetical protein
MFILIRKITDPGYELVRNVFASVPQKYYRSTTDTKAKTTAAEKDLVGNTLKL